MNTQLTTGLHMRQFFNLLRRRRKLIIITVAVAVGLAGTVGLVFPPRYTGTAEVIVDPPRVGSGPAELSIVGVLDDAAVQTHVAALLSHDHLRRVFDALVTERGPAPKEVRGLLGAEEFSIENFTKRINAFKDTRSRMIGITYTSTDPAFAAAVANRSVGIYLATLTERTVADRNDALRSLNRRIPLVRAEADSADSALQNYRIKHGLADAGRMDMVDQQLVDLNRQLAVARSDLAELRARPTSLTVGQTTNQGQLAEESSTLKTRVDQLQRRIAILQDAGSEVREPEMQLRELQRKATNLAQLYESLVQRQKAILGEDKVQPDVRVLSLASLPTLPSSLNPLLFIPPVLVLALIGSGLMAVLLDQLDGTLRTEQDIADALGVSCAGATPRFTSSTTSRSDQLLAQDVRYTEAVRSIVAAALGLADQREPPKTFLVTSSVSNEGKTTLAISFAAYAAQIGRRVLLIDLSFRHPSIAKEMGEAADAETSHLLQGRPDAEVIRAAPDLGFDYLLLARQSADPVAIVTSARTQELLRELEEGYDCLVIDSASLLDAAEARLLASMVDKVLFAVKWGSTEREIAGNALDLLQRSAFVGSDLRDVVTAVMTQVDLEKHARYRYGDFSENLFHVKPILGEVGR
jgi:uncharacterized protein involved in exopolysaccharide biosynthesis